jgi:hypothetical protein
VLALRQHLANRPGERDLAPGARRMLPSTSTAQSATGITRISPERVLCPVSTEMSDWCDTRIARPSVCESITNAASVCASRRLKSWKNELNSGASTTSPGPGNSAVSRVRHHWLVNTASKEMPRARNAAPRARAGSRPHASRLLCVVQSSSRKVAGSSAPGASAWRMIAKRPGSARASQSFASTRASIGKRAKPSSASDTDSGAGIDIHYSVRCLGITAGRSSRIETVCGPCQSTLGPAL